MDDLAGRPIERRPSVLETRMRRLTPRPRLPSDRERRPLSAMDRAVRILRAACRIATGPPHLSTAATVFAATAEQILSEGGYSFFDLISPSDAASTACRNRVRLPSSRNSGARTARVGALEPFGDLIALTISTASSL